MKTNLCVIFGGMSSEYEVSLSTAHSIISNLDREKYDVKMLGITKEGVWYLYDGDPDLLPDNSWCRDEEHLTRASVLPSRGVGAIVRESDGKKYPIDVIFPAVHGEYAEDGSLQGLLELSGIPFVGSGCKASAAAMDKATTKAVISQTEVKQADCIVVSGEEIERDIGKILAKVGAKLSYPVFVKPSSAGSSVGVSKVTSPEKLEAALKLAARTDNSKVLIEKFIKGREIEVAVMGNDSPRASVCGEIDPGADFYDYETKYHADTASYFIPARLDEDVAARVRASALIVYRAIGCRGLSRVDFFVTDENEIIFNEINTLPGFTSISMYPKLFMACGMTYPQILDTLIGLANPNRQSDLA